MLKNALNFFFVSMLLGGSCAFAKTATETLEGAAAFAVYQKLPGVACPEYAGKNYVALTKYGSKTCSGPEFNKNRDKSWACNVQGNPKDLKKGIFTSCSCTREVLAKD